VFTRVLEAKGFAWHSVLCKVGSVDKTAIGISRRTEDPAAAATRPSAIPSCRRGCSTHRRTDLNVLSDCAWVTMPCSPGTRRRR